MKLRFKQIRYSLLFFLLFFVQGLQAAYILIPMDEAQKNHLKSYGIAFWILKHDVEWIGC